MKVQLQRIKPSPHPIRKTWDEDKMRELTWSLLEECQVGISGGLFGTGLATREDGELNQLSDEQLRSLLEKLETQRPSDSKD